MSPRSSFDSERILQVRTILREYGIPKVEEDVAQKILVYVELLMKWRKKMSLTTITTEEEILRFHFGESIFALTFVDMTQGRLADVGSGAGFPAIPLKVFRNELSVWLIERNKKKCAFLHEVVRELELPDVHIVPSGYEESGIQDASLNFVVSRGLGERENLANWAFQILEPMGNLVLWSGAEDLPGIQGIPGGCWGTPKKIPRTRERFIICGCRQEQGLF